MQPAFIPKTFPDKFDIIQLPHPSTGKSGSFIILDNKLYEVNLVDRPQSSFFIGEKVFSNGSAFLILPFNPVYMIISLRSTHLKELFPVNEFFFNTPFQPYADFFKPYLEKVGESMNIPDLGEVWHLSQEKINEFLVSQAQKLLPYVKSLKPFNDDNLLIEFAWDILRHYICQELSDILKASLKTRYPGSFPIKQIFDVLNDGKDDNSAKSTQKSSSQSKSSQKTTTKKKDKSTPIKGNKSLFDFMSPKKK